MHVVSATWHKVTPAQGHFLIKRHSRCLSCRFKVGTALFSGRRRVGGLTISTAGNTKRLHMLDALCATWAGPLAVAVWHPVLASGGDNGTAADGADRPDLPTVVQHVRELFARLLNPVVPGSPLRRRLRPGCQF